MRTIRFGFVIFLCLMLCGCTAREMEDREFVQVMELDLRGGRLAGGFGKFMVEGETVKEIQKAYQSEVEGYLDLGHIKAIVLGQELLDHKERLRDVLLELEQMPLISRNSLVFSHVYEGEESYLAKLTEQGKEPVAYLCDRFHNNPYRSDTEIPSLGEFINRMDS